MGRDTMRAGKNKKIIQSPSKNHRVKTAFEEEKGRN